MKFKFLLLLAVTFIFAGAAFGQTVFITPKKQTYTRKRPMSEWKKTFEITYPKVKAATPAISKKIESLLSYEKNFDFTIAEEMGEIQWLEEATYEVDYNQGKALSVSLSIQGSGAYPSGLTKYVVINSATGTRAMPATEFIKTKALIAKLDAMLQKEIAAALIEIKADKENEDIDPKELFDGKTFTAENLEDFSINDTGITFRYRYNFVHAIMALEPAGEFKFTWSEIKPYLNPRGLLATVAR